MYYPHIHGHHLFCQNRHTHEKMTPPCGGVAAAAAGPVHDLQRRRGAVPGVAGGRRRHQEAGIRPGPPSLPDASQHQCQHLASTSASTSVPTPLRADNENGIVTRVPSHGWSAAPPARFSARACLISQFATGDNHILPAVKEKMKAFCD